MFWLKQRPRDPKSLASSVYKCVARETWGLASPYAFGCYSAITENWDLLVLLLLCLFSVFIQITLCCHYSVIAMKVLILILLQDAKNVVEE